MQIQIDQKLKKYQGTQQFYKNQIQENILNVIQFKPKKIQSEHFKQYLSNTWLNISKIFNSPIKNNSQQLLQNSNTDFEIFFFNSNIQKYKQNIIDNVTSTQQQEDISFNQKQDQPIKNKSNCTIQLLEQSPKSKFITFLVRISIFKVKITVLNFQKQLKSCVDSMNLLAKGSFGFIYEPKTFNNHKKIDQDRWIVKRFYFRSFLDYDELGHIIKEYAFLKIFSFLKIGLNVVKPTLFDILCFEEYCEFFMEKGDTLENIQFDKIQTDLYENLRIIHSLQIVHNDIKPDNIMYSNQFKKVVFIDFGLTQFLNEKIGQKTFTLYKGSIKYCSQEMQKTYFLNEENQVDLYWNDLQCLKTSLIQIKHQIIRQNSHMSRLMRQKQKYVQSQFQQKQVQKHSSSHFLAKKQVYSYDQVRFINYIYKSQFDLFNQKFRDLNQSHKKWMVLEIIDIFIDLFPTPEVQNIFKKYFNKYLADQKIDNTVREQLKIKYLNNQNLIKILNKSSNFQIKTKNEQNYKIRYRNVQAHLSFVRRDLAHINLIKCIRDQKNQNLQKFDSSLQKVQTHFFNKNKLHILISILNFLHSHLLIIPLKQILNVLQQCDKYLQNVFLNIFPLKNTSNCLQKEQQKVTLYLKIAENYLLNDEKKEIEEWNIMQKVIEIYTFINDGYYLTLIEKFLTEYKFYIPLRKKVYYYYLLYERCINFQFESFMEKIQGVIKQSEKIQQKVFQTDLKYIQTLKSMIILEQQQKRYSLVHHFSTKQTVNNNDSRSYTSMNSILIKHKGNLHQSFHRLDCCQQPSFLQGKNLQQKKINKQLSQEEQNCSQNRNRFYKTQLQRFSLIFIELQKKIQKEAFFCYVLVQLQLIKRLLQKFKRHQAIIRCQNLLKRCGIKDLRLYSQQINLIYTKLAQCYQLSGMYEKTIYYSKKTKSQVYAKAFQFFITIKNNHDIKIQKAKQIFKQCVQLILKQHKLKNQQNQKIFWSKILSLIFFFGVTIIQDSEMNEILERLKQIFDHNEIQNFRQIKSTGYLNHIFTQFIRYKTQSEEKKMYTLEVLKKYLKDAESLAKADSQFTQFYWQIKLMVTFEIQQNFQKVLQIQKRYQDQLFKTDAVEVKLFWLNYYRKMMLKFQNTYSSNKLQKIILLILKSPYNGKLLDPNFWLYNIEYIKILLKNKEVLRFFQFMISLSEVSEQNRYLEGFCPYNYFHFVQCIQNTNILQEYKEQIYNYLKKLLINNHFHSIIPEIYIFFCMILHNNPSQKDEDCIRILKKVTNKAQSYDKHFRKILHMKNKEFFYDKDCKQTLKKRTLLLNQMDKQKFLKIKLKNKLLEKHSLLTTKLKNKSKRWKLFSQSRLQYETEIFGKMYLKKF